MKSETSILLSRECVSIVLTTLGGDAVKMEIFDNNELSLFNDNHLAVKIK